MESTPDEYAGAHERLEAELAHAQIGFEGERGEFPRQGVVVVFDGIGDDELLAVTAEATAFSEKLRKASVAARIIGSARIHHAESVALHLAPAAVPVRRKRRCRSDCWRARPLWREDRQDQKPRRKGREILRSAPDARSC